jgi:hypothetical protein
VRRRPAPGKLEPAVKGEGSVVIPRHEWPGRIVLSVGLFTSWWCVVGLIVLKRGG